MRGKKTGGGSRKGVPNKATAQVRAVIATLARTTAPKLGAWLEAVEDPGRRVDLALKLLEYDIPKLGRVEVTGEDGGPLQVNLVNYSPAKQLGSAAVSDESLVRSRTGLPPRRTLPP